MTPIEFDRLTIFTAAELARRRQIRGLKVAYPRPWPYICLVQRALPHAGHLRSDSQGMGRIGEVIRHTWQLAHQMKRLREDNPTRAHGLERW